jgi:hypothetical protein
MSSGCGCSSAAKKREVLRTTQNLPTKGGYILMTYPGCSTPHTGEYAGGSTYVVGRNTEFEQLFRHNDLTDATTHALATGSGIENLPNTVLCDQAVIDLYASV